MRSMDTTHVHLSLFEDAKIICLDFNASKLYTKTPRSGNQFCFR